MTDSTADALPDDVLQFAHALFDLARAGDAAQLTAAIDQGVPVDLTDAQGNTLLMLAAYHGHAALVAALAERGADLDRPNDRGQTPLAGAVFKRSAEVIEALVSRGADPDAGTPSARATAEMFNVKLPSGQRADEPGR
ncbi:ankyrin repeat domain-containing protein [Leucobacter chromiireducens]|uniref:ankyrin repeat domain-containing protein n=1 Tax=Leucobacter chromiireducens TaxID=283877 RepID=UPI000F63AEB4|nr:ankyrin repeat domain-containing protein [Leucobacter chromiireducens]